MRTTSLLALTLCCLTCLGCDDDEPSPAPTNSPSSEEIPESDETQAEASEEPGAVAPATPADEPPRDESATNDAQDECRLVVLDQDPPLRVRSGPSSSSAQRGQLENGTIVHSVERRDGYVRIMEPVAGWVFRGMLMRTCDAPPALAALPLGERTYLFLPGPSKEGEEPGTPLPPPVMELDLVGMRLSFRDARPIESPIPITLVSARGSCERNVTRRVLLVGACPESSMGGAYSTAMEALEVASCPELHPRGDEIIHPAQPMMIGLVGHHENARMETWSRTEAPLTAGQRRVIERRIRRIVADMEPEYRATSTPEMPEVMTHFDGSPWGWAYLDEVHLLFHGDTLMDDLDLTASFPRRVRAGTDLLVGIGAWGHHGYGFYMFPDEAHRGLARESRYPTFSCGPN